MRRRLPSSLLVRFNVLSATIIVLLALVLGVVLREQIEARALTSAEQRAATVATSIERRLSVERLAGMDAAERARFEREAVDHEVDAGDIRRVKVFNHDPRVVYSDDPAQVGHTAAKSDLVREALEGKVGSKFVMGTNHTGDGERMLEVFVPLRRKHQGRAAGVLEIYLPAAPVEAAARADTRRLYVVLAIGLLVLWLALYRIVASASRALRGYARRERHQARHDPLTGLGNRRALHEQAGRMLDAAGDCSALLLVDLDHFKEVNDTLGHDQGDVLLRGVADRLRSVIRPGDVLARLGGDEFAIFLPGLSSPDVAVRRAKLIREVLEPAVMLDALSVRIDASIGVALHPEDGDSIDALLKHADVAMYVAKESPDRVRRYAADLDPYSHDRLVLAGELRTAIERGELVVHYQPILDAADRSVHAVEALVRWQHPERGLLPPAEFLPLASRTGTIGALTKFVIEQAVQDALRWQLQGRDIAVACNLDSAAASDDSLPQLVQSALERWPLRPDRLVLELSEDTVISDPLRVGQIVDRLHEMGVRLALDDFGTGNSSLAHLRRLPLDQLKIDRTFIMRGLTDVEDRAVINAILAMAQSLGLETVAEGVELESVATALNSVGCDRLQGFLFSRAIPAAALEDWLAEHDAAATAGAQPSRS